MRKPGAALLVWFLCLSSSSDWIQTEDTNAKIKAIYIYNFTKYIEWPSSYKEGHFVIGIYSNYNTFYQELNKMSLTKNVGAQKFEIRNFSSLDDFAKCHMLYITADKANEIREVSKKLKGMSTLIITEKPGLAKLGAAINFVVRDNKQKFEINKSNIEKYRLKVSQGLLSLAILIE